MAIPAPEFLAAGDFQPQLNSVQPTLLDSYLNVVNTAHKAIDVAGEILSIALHYVGKGIKYSAVVLAYPVIFVVGGIGMLLWKGAALAGAGIARGIHTLDGVLYRQPSVN